MAVFVANFNNAGPHDVKHMRWISSTKRGYNVYSVPDGVRGQQKMEEYLDNSQSDSQYMQLVNFEKVKKHKSACCLSLSLSLSLIPAAHLYHMCNVHTALDFLPTHSQKLWDEKRIIMDKHIIISVQRLTFIFFSVHAYSVSAMVITKTPTFTYPIRQNTASF